MSFETILQVPIVIIIICNNLLSLEKAFDLVIVHQWWYSREYFKQSQTRQVYNGPRVVKFISAKGEKFWSKMIFEQKQTRKMHKSCIIND